MSEAKIRNILLKHGQLLFESKKDILEFTEVPEADRLLNDLKGHPHAFLIGCIMDRQMPAELA